MKASKLAKTSLFQEFPHCGEVKDDTIRQKIYLDLTRGKTLKAQQAHGKPRGKIFARGLGKKNVKTCSRNGLRKSRRIH